MKARRWSDFSPRQQGAIVALGAVEIALAAAAWSDLYRRPAEEINGSKARWALIIAINVFGPLSYFRWGRRPHPGRPAPRA